MTMVCYFAHFEQSLKGLRPLCLQCTLSGDSTGRRTTPMRGIIQPISGTLKKFLVSAIDLICLPTNIDNMSIVLCSPIRH